jgi:UDP-N-acetylmuramate dehydrogenase
MEIEIQNNFSLKATTASGIEAKAKQFVSVHSVAELNRFRTT